jgi:hypothetical protein
VAAEHIPRGGETKIRKTELSLEDKKKIELASEGGRK